MRMHTQVVCILIFGLAVLAILFGTRLLWDRRSKVLPYKAIFAAAIGLACTAFATQYLILGLRPLPYPFRAAPLVFCVVVLGSALLKRVRAR